MAQVHADACGQLTMRASRASAASREEEAAGVDEVEASSGFLSVELPPPPNPPPPLPAWTTLLPRRSPHVTLVEVTDGDAGDKLPLYALTPHLLLCKVWLGNIMVYKQFMKMF